MALSKEKFKSTEIILEKDPIADLLDKDQDNHLNDAQITKYVGKVKKIMYEQNGNIKKR